LKTRVGVSGYLAFDRDPARVEAGELEGHSVVYGDGASADVIKASGVEKPRAIIVAHDLPERCLESTEKLHIAFPSAQIYARAQVYNTQGYIDLTASETLKEELLKAGATEVVVEAVQIAKGLDQAYGANIGRGISSLEGAVVPTGGDVVCAEEFCMPRAVLKELSEEEGLPMAQILALQELFATSPERDAKGRVLLSELRDELIRKNETPLDDETLNVWMNLDDTMGKWVTGKQEETYITFEQFVTYAAKNPALLLDEVEAPLYFEAGK